MPWLLYALLSPLFFAIGNVLDKFLRSRHLGTFTFAVFVGLMSFWVLALIPFVGFPASFTVIIAGLLAGVLFFASGFPYFQALSIEEASRVVPLWALEAPWTLVMAFLFLNERLMLTDYAGFILVVAGAFMVSTRSLAGLFKPNKALLLILLASSLTSSSIVLSKWLYSQLSFWQVQLLANLGSGLVALLLLLVFSNQRKVFLKEMSALNKAAVFQLGIRQLVFFSASLVFGLAIMTGSPSLSVALVKLAAVYVFIIATFLSKFWPHILAEGIDKKALLTKAVAIVMIIAGVFAINR